MASWAAAPGVRCGLTKPDMTQYPPTTAPYASSTSASKHVDAVGCAKPDQERILIVDDSAVERHVYSKYLSQRYLCDEAESFDEAIKLFRQRPYSLVITDIIMPGLSGIELLRKVLEIDRDCAVIMVSGVDRPQRALDALRLGAFDYIFKPCERDVLELTVERAIEKRNLLLSARQYQADLKSRNLQLARQKAELERLQAQLVNNEKMASLGQLAAGVAHEINNPVGFIYGNIDLLADRAADLGRFVEDPAAFQSDRVRKVVEDVSAIVGDCREGAERIRDIVENLKTFSRLDEADLKQADLNEGIHSTTRLLSRYFSRENITLIEDYGQIPAIDAFSGQLNQVWMNLLVNAAQAVEKNGGEVRICTRMVDGDTVAISVSDTGQGIAPEDVDRIFDPFFTTKPVGEGTGLGLSISFGIVERHGGTISVNSKLDAGSTFIVTLPTRIDHSVDILQ